jgi:general L-amino acid transport system substrate-binding protein
MKISAMAFTAIIISAAHALPAQAGQTFDAVKAKGSVHCGVNSAVVGFAYLDSRGVFQGLDIDLCRAIGAAMFGSADKVRMTALSPQQRFTALQSGEVDVLVRNTTVTLMRDVSLGLAATGVNFYDGQGFMVAKKLGVKSALELSGATICVAPGTTTELNLADYFRAHRMQFSAVVIDKVEEVNAAFFSGRCDVLTTDASQLASIRTALASKPDDYAILPELISKEPLGPFVRQGDQQWFNVVKWTLMAMVEAEELGISQKNVDEMLKSSNPAVQRMLGVTPGFGKALGLDEKWAYNVIKQVGNYGESFERNLGKGSKIGLERGANDLWTRGGLIYALPMR